MQPEHCKHHGADAENCCLCVGYVLGIFLALTGQDRLFGHVDVHRKFWSNLMMQNTLPHTPYHWADRVAKLVALCHFKFRSFSVLSVCSCVTSMILAVLQSNTADGCLVLREAGWKADSGLTPVLFGVRCSLQVASRWALPEKSERQWLTATASTLPGFSCSQKSQRGLAKTQLTFCSCSSSPSWDASSWQISIAVSLDSVSVRNLLVIPLDAS